MRWTPRRARLAALAIPIAVFAIKFRYVGSGDTVPAELLPIQILEHGTLTFPHPAGASLPYWFHQTPRGVVSSYPILPGLVNVPVYAVARLLGADLYASRTFLSHVTAAACATASVFLVYLILQRLLPSPGPALGFALVYAFCTEVWSVASRGIWQHTPALLFLSAGLYALLRRTRGWDFAAGACLLLAFLSRPTTIALVVPMALWAVWREHRRAGMLTAGAVIPAVLHAIYAWRYWGSPLSLAQPVGPGGFYGDALQGLAGLLVSPSRGLFVFSPVFLFAIPATVAAFRRSEDPRAPLMRSLAIGTLLTLALYSRWGMWWGGHSFGYRLLIELALPLTILVAWDWPRIRESRAGRILFAGAAVFSVLVQGLGALEYPTSFNAEVDRDRLMLWDVPGTELALRARRVFGPIPSTEGATLAPWLRPATPPAPEWWSGATDDETIPRALDWPAEGRIIRGPLGVIGWAKPAVDDAGQVLISVNPGGRRVSADRFPRPDVAAAAPFLGDAAAAGFGKRFPPPDRLESAAVLVEVRDRRGRVARMGPVQFLWAPAARGQ